MKREYLRQQIRASNSAKKGRNPAYMHTPAVRDRSWGLRVTPYTWLNVCEPVPNSGVLVLPMMMAPARLMSLTCGSSAPATCVSAHHGDPTIRIRTFHQSKIHIYHQTRSGICTQISYEKERNFPIRVGITQSKSTNFIQKGARNLHTRVA